MIGIRLRTKTAGKVAAVSGFDADFLGEIGEDPTAPNGPVVKDPGGAGKLLNP
jgi:hypothetical protein